MSKIKNIFDAQVRLYRHYNPDDKSFDARVDNMQTRFGKQLPNMLGYRDIKKAVHFWTRFNGPR